MFFTISQQQGVAQLTLWLNLHQSPLQIYIKIELRSKLPTTHHPLPFHHSLPHLFSFRPRSSSYVYFLVQRCKYTENNVKPESHSMCHLCTHPRLK